MYAMLVLDMFLDNGLSFCFRMIIVLWNVFLVSLCVIVSVMNIMAFELGYYDCLKPVCI